MDIIKGTETGLYNLCVETSSSNPQIDLIMNNYVLFVIDKVGCKKFDIDFTYPTDNEPITINFDKKYVAQGLMTIDFDTLVIKSHRCNVQLVAKKHTFTKKYYHTL